MMKNRKCIVFINDENAVFINDENVFINDENA
jgi:hypothetical protein